MKKLLYLIPLFFLLRTASAQTPPPDQLHVSFDKPFYVSGEIIWFSVQVLNPQEAPSRLLFLDIVNADGELLDRQKLAVNEGHAHGDFTIPLEWQEAYYQFRFYSRWNINYGEDFVYAYDVPIYNEFEGDLVPPDAEISSEEAIETVSGKLKLEVVGLQDTYERGDNVRLQIRASRNGQSVSKARLLVSVLDAALFPNDLTAPKQAKLQKNPPPPAKLSFAPDTSLMLRAIISDPVSKTPVTTRFMAVHLSQSNTMYNTEVEEGLLQLTIPEFYGQQWVQGLNLNPFQNPIPTIDLPGHSTPSVSLPPQKKPERSPGVMQYLYLSKLRRKLDEIFEQNLTYLPLEPEQEEEPDADKTFYMEDYQLIEDIETFIKKFVFKSRFLGEGTSKTLRLYSKETQKQFEEQPWYLVDGYLTRDEQAVFSLPLEEIERIAFFYRKRTILKHFAPLMLRSGVLAIYSKKGNLLVEEARLDRNSVLFEGFAPRKTFKVEDSGAPDFRPLVYWNPLILTDENGIAEVSFVNSDAVSNFVIRLTGISGEGDWGSLQFPYATTFE